MGKARDGAAACGRSGARAGVGTIVRRPARRCRDRSAKLFFVPSLVCSFSTQTADEVGGRWLRGGSHRRRCGWCSRPCLAIIFADGLRNGLGLRHLGTGHVSGTAARATIASRREGVLRRRVDLAIARGDISLGRAARTVAIAGMVLNSGQTERPQDFPDSVRFILKPWRLDNVLPIMQDASDPL